MNNNFRKNNGRRESYRPNKTQPLNETQRKYLATGNTLISLMKWTSAFAALLGMGSIWCGFKADKAK